jgi:hypothetical protein
MTYTKESPEWLLIRANSNNWFSKENLKFWGSRIYWNTLCQIDGNWFFITHEDNFDASQKLFSIRSITPKGDFETVSWQQHETLVECKQNLNRMKQDA